MKEKFLAIVMLVFLFCSISFAQSDETPKAVLFDKFGSVGECAFGAYMDTFLVSLMKNPEVRGTIIVYQGANVLPGNRNSSITKLYNNYLKFRRFDASRVDIIFGGFRNKRETELWIVPEDATQPKSTNTVPKPTVPKNKTYLYNHIYMDATTFFIPREVERMEMEITDEDREWAYHWVDNNFAQMIKESKGSRGVIVYYADDEYHDLGKILAHLIEAKRRMTKDVETSFEKIDIVFGGFRGGIEFELWIVPKNDKMPEFSPQERFVDDEAN